MRKEAGILFAIFFIPGLLFSAGLARGAEVYPEKEIRVIVGFPPGSAVELSVRAIVQVAAKYVKRPLVVLNMPGGAQTIAMAELVRSAPDGYTIAMTTDGYKSLTIHQQKLRFDPNAIRIVAGYARFTHVLFVKGDSPYAQYDQFIAYGRKNPEAMNYSGSGEGSAPDLIGKVFFRDTSLRATYVPFKGSNEYIQAVMGGHVLSGIIDISGVRRHVKSGALKLVVVFADQRLEEFPDVPSSREKGLSDLNIFNSILCIAVHKDTPPEKFAFLHDAFRKATEDPDFRKLAQDMGLKAVYTSPQAAEQGIQKTGAAGIPLLKGLGLFVE